MARLLRLAGHKLGAGPRRVADEEDVVVAAFASFCRAAEAGRFVQLDDRNDLWQLLLMLTERKARDQLRRQGAEKRGGGRVRGHSAFQPPVSPDSPDAGLEQVVDGQPTPAFAAEAAEELGRLLDALQDERLRRIAVAKMESYSNQEIAELMSLSLRAVERQLRLIRQIWQEVSRDE